MDCSSSKIKDYIMDNKILLTGSEGQLGQAFINTKPKDITNESIELFAFNKNVNVSAE